MKMRESSTILERLASITQSLASVQSLDELSKAIYDIVEQLTTVEFSGVYIMDFAHQRLQLRHTKGFTPTERDEAERTAWDRHPGWVVRNKQILHVPDTALDDRSQTSKRTANVRSRIWVPILTPEKAVGALGLASTLVNAFSSEDILLLQYAATAAGFMFSCLHDRWLLEEQMRVVEEQRRELDALSSPLVEVAQGIMVLPIIGRMSETRAQQMTEKLLAVISERNMRAVILDLTGVATIDAASIEHLERMHRAVRLLGSDCVFSGISGRTAALMTEVGTDLVGWSTYATVRQALSSFSGSKAIPKLAGS
jgi:anti-anti-sigma regulatory factor/putative methionine-R-sulfoxide reductase with GAF domain